MSDKRELKTVAREGPLVRSVSMPLVGASVSQGALLLIDTSGSMAGAKIGEAIAAARACIDELGDAKNRGAFHVSVGVFGETAKEHLALKPASQVQPEELAAEVGDVGGMTNITAGLALALSIVERPRPGTWAKTVVVLLTDGGHNHGPTAPHATAATLKAKADLICVAFGGDADLKLLERLANTPQHAFKCGNGADLRKFFANVGRTISQAARSGQNAAALLASGGVLRG
jgi:uncharacterized protein YegL